MASPDLFRLVRGHCMKNSTRIPNRAQGAATVAVLIVLGSLDPIAVGAEKLIVLLVCEDFSIQSIASEGPRLLTTTSSYMVNLQCPMVFEFTPTALPTQTKNYHKTQLLHILSLSEVGG